MISDFLDWVDSTSTLYEAAGVIGSIIVIYILFILFLEQIVLTWRGK